MGVDYEGVIGEAKKAAKLTFDGLRQIFREWGIPEPFRTSGAAAVAGLVLLGRVLYIGTVFLFVSTGTTLITYVLQTIKQIRQDGGADFAEVTGEAVGEFMAIDTKSVDFKSGKEPEQVLQRARQLGDLIITMLQSQFGTTGPQTPDKGEAAAKALAGYGVNFATSNVFLSWLIELGTEGHLGDFDKLGEDIAQTLGLGRLTRRALQPLVRNAISHPYDRKMRALYRADIPAVSELIKATLAGRMSESQARTYLAQHGFAEEFITEMFAQHEPRLTAHELVQAEAYGLVTPERSLQALRDEGIPDNVAAMRLATLRDERRTQLKRKVIDEALALAKDREISPVQFGNIVDNALLPDDEAQAYRDRLGIWLDSQHRKLSKLDVLFLYEHGQFTLDELDAWMAEEGYSPQDQLALTLEFLQKKGDFENKKTAASDRKPKALHNQRVAFITREYQSILGRDPLPEELAAYVAKLDSGERTRADVTAELKALAGK